MREFNYEVLKSLALDAEIVSMISQVYEYKGKHNQMINSKPLPLESLAKIAKIQSVEFSNKIEGIVTTENRYKELLQEAAAPQTRDEEEILGYRDLLELIHENYQEIALTPNVILQLHRDLYKYQGGTHFGKFKSVDNVIQEIDRDGKKRVRFKTLEAYLTPDAIARICEEYTKAIKLYECEPLLATFTFVFDFLCVHPFNDGNGRLSRLLTLLLLYQNGFQVGKYISLEKMIENTKVGYYDTLLKSSQKWHENENDVLFFVKYSLQIILAAYRKLDEQLETMTSLSKSDQIKQLFDSHLGKLTKAKIKELLPNVSESTIEVSLRNLVKSGQIKKIGKGSTTSYITLPTSAK